VRATALPVLPPDNRVTDAGARALADLLRTNAKLRELLLGRVCPPSPSRVPTTWGLKRNPAGDLIWVGVFLEAVGTAPLLPATPSSNHGAPTCFYRPQLDNLMRRV